MQSTSASSSSTSNVRNVLVLAMRLYHMLHHFQPAPALNVTSRIHLPSTSSKDVDDSPPSRKSLALLKSAEAEQMRVTTLMRMDEARSTHLTRCGRGGRDVLELAGVNSATRELELHVALRIHYATHALNQERVLRLSTDRSVVPSSYAFPEYHASLPALRDRLVSKLASSMTFADQVPRLIALALEDYLKNLFQRLLQRSWHRRNVMKSVYPIRVTSEPKVELLKCRARQEEQMDALNEADQRGDRAACRALLEDIGTLHMSTSAPFSPPRPLLGSSSSSSTIPSAVEASINDIIGRKRKSSSSSSMSPASSLLSPISAAPGAVSLTSPPFTTQKKNKTINMQDLCQVLHESHRYRRSTWSIRAALHKE